MELLERETESADVLIIGGGGAALRAAIAARETGADVLVVSKSKIGHSNNTYISAGAFAATGWGDASDNDAVHMEDAVIGGRFLNDQPLLAAATKGAGRQVSALEQYGVRFFKRDGNLLLGRAPGHTKSRGVSVIRRSGIGFMDPLKAHAEKVGVRFLSHVFISRLMADQGRIAGATGVSQDGNFVALSSPAVILATGGFGQLFQCTNNAAGITGDGLSLAFDLGLSLRDMEFVQFYPTAVGTAGNRMILYEVVVAQFGAVLRNADGEDIAEKHGMADQKAMTRDRMSRAVMSEILEGRDIEGGVILDLSPVPDHPQLAAFLPREWRDRKQPLLVSPTTHFCMGGVVTNDRTETAIPGLFAAGEVCGGVHGANRLGGNALAEVFALGELAGTNAAGSSGETGPSSLPQKAVDEELARLQTVCSKTGESQNELRRSLRQVMWLRAGIIRDHLGLIEAIGQIESLERKVEDAQVDSPRQLMKVLELKNMLLLARIVCRAALLRTESRGAHYRSDYPEEDNSRWIRNIISRKRGEAIHLEQVPVSLDPVDFRSA